MVQQLPIAAGLEAEQALLASVCRGEQGDGVLFWQPVDQALVMPRRMSRVSGFDAACEVSAAHGWPVLLRETGGEPVPQSPAVVNVALVYSAPRSEGDQHRLERAYQRLCQPMAELLESLGGAASLGEVPGAFCDGRYNVNLNGRKWVGTAQRWRQGASGQRPVVLVHGAMLMDNQREAMAAAVNRFNECCGLAQRCLAGSHIAFNEVWPVGSWLQPLQQAFGAVLQQVRLAQGQGV